MHKILLDTDIGSDIDDALCLAHLLANPECELMGITTVTGQGELRARLASVLCKVAGKRVPIYPGAEKPLLIAQNQTCAPHAASLPRWDHDVDFLQGQAVSFMRDCIRSNPHEIVLLAIGPLTNIAALFSMDQEIPSLLKSLVMMNGVFSNELPNVGPLEWNAMADPHATAIVYNHPAPVHRSVGLEITCRLCLQKDEAMALFTHELLKPVTTFAEEHFKQRDYIVFHDPLAACTIFDGAICDFRKGTIDIELHSPKLTGFTYWTDNELAGIHHRAISVDEDRFFSHFFSVFQ